MNLSLISRLNTPSASSVVQQEIDKILNENSAEPNTLEAGFLILDLSKKYASKDRFYSLINYVVLFILLLLQVIGLLILLSVTTNLLIIAAVVTIATFIDGAINDTISSLSWNAHTKQTQLEIMALSWNKKAEQLLEVR